MGIHLRVTALLLAMMASSTAGWAQNPLPPCPAERHPQNARWHNCFGTFTSTNGNKYVGEYKDDKRHGQGTATFANGNKYVGEWRDGNFNGQGTLTLADGDKYVGEFRDNKYHGQGTLTFADGTKYVGEHRDGSANGQGTAYTRDGVVIKNGVWQGDDFVAANSLPLSVPKSP